MPGVTTSAMDSRLRIFDEEHPDEPILVTRDRAEMARRLREIGVAYEQWEASKPVAPGATPEEVMDAYRADIDRLVAEHGFRSVDVVSIAPDHPQREQMRAKLIRDVWKAGGTSPRIWPRSCASFAATRTCAGGSRRRRSPAPGRRAVRCR